MDRVLAVCFLGAALSASGQVAGAGKEQESVTGTVVDALSGAAIPGAALTLGPVDNARGVAPLSGRSGPEGKFGFRQVPPGEYLLFGSARGYRSGRFGATPGNSMGSRLTVEAGRVVGAITLKLMPQAVITGIVLNASEQPVAGARVAALAAGYRRGNLRYSTLREATTNDRGEFRLLDLVPGKVILQVFTPRDMTQPRRKPGEPNRAYVTSFYPGVTEISAALPVNAVAGQNGPLNLPLLLAETVSVVGHVAGLESASEASVALSPPDFSMALGLATWLRGGSFTLPNVPAGSYRLWIAHDGKTYGREPLQVGDRDLEGLEFEAGLADVTGSLRIEGDSKPDMARI